MSRPKLRLPLVLAATIVATVLVARSADIGAVGVRLVVKVDNVSGKAKLISQQRGAALSTGAGGNPAVLQGNLQVYYVDDPANSAALAMPAPWLRNSGKVARFTNKLSPAGPTAVRAAMLRSGGIAKVVARGLGGLDISVPPGSGGVIVVYTFENGNDASVHRICSRYSTADGSSVKHRNTSRGHRLHLKNGISVACPSCGDGVLNGDETDVDCGGPSCSACGDGSSCSVDGDCSSGVCNGGVCQAAGCSDGVLNGDESDVDCGGSCPACSPGQSCNVGGDCDTGICSSGVCVLPPCANGVMDGNETDVDCGGDACPACGLGQGCSHAADCTTLSCVGNICQAPSCSDGAHNGDETDVDCGGSCPGCADGGACAGAGDCLSGVCTGNQCQTASCSDGVQNGDESDVDCGGSCAACLDGGSCTVDGDCQSGVCAGNECQAASCSDGVQNGDETDVDCGGTCAACGTGGGCAVAADCQSGVCLGNECQAPSCSDAIKNGDETDVDCGGGCPACADGSICQVADDCQSSVCVSNFCQTPTCHDGVQNGDEDGVDCGGASCGACSCETRGECIMFVTSTSFGGNLGGLAGADSLCNLRAAEAALVGTYQAWLCDGITAPADRSLKASVPYRRTDGALIASNWADLTDGSLANPINRDQHGNDLSATSPFLPWTYVTSAGTCDDETYLSPGSGPCPAFSNCKTNCANNGANNGWTSGSGLAQGSKGDINATNGNWTDGVTGLCSTPAERIYCIEQ